MWHTGNQWRGRRVGVGLLIALGGWLFVAAGARGQDVPWDTFIDSESDSVCDLINGSNTEFVVLSSTGELVVVSGEDVILGDSFVDGAGTVFFGDLSYGFITYAEDADGYRTLWWVDELGYVVDLDTFSLAPVATFDRPVDFANVPCDACDYWDDPADCEPVVVVDGGSDDGPVLMFNFCGAGMLTGMFLSLFGLAGLTRMRPRLG